MIDTFNWKVLGLMCICVTRPHTQAHQRKTRLSFDCPSCWIERQQQDNQHSAAGHSGNHNLFIPYNFYGTPGAFRQLGDFFSNAIHGNMFAGLSCPAIFKVKLGHVTSQLFSDTLFLFALGCLKMMSKKSFPSQPFGSLVATGIRL